MPENREELIAHVCKIAAEQVAVDPATVSPASHLHADLNFDSLDDVEFTMSIEDAFDVSIPDEAASAVRTVGDAVELLESHFAAAAR
jgi:acyl carrier protein